MVADKHLVVNEVSKFSNSWGTDRSPSSNTGTNNKKREFNEAENLSFEEMLDNARKAFGFNLPSCNLEVVDSVVDDLSVLLFEEKTLEGRLSNIEHQYNGTQLEAILGVPSTYYRDKYFALLRLLSPFMK